ncbi:MAG: (d)CMP kinase [Bacteroidales bacterium]|nr:(d)CMP kinase [Candidatus Cryptobacteroides aphodequi]
MKLPDIIIAIDGCSSTGKSTFAKLLAKELGLVYLDSGALYRAVTLFAQEEHLISRMNIIRPELEGALRSLPLRFSADNRTFIGDRCVEREIRTLEVSAQVSPIAALPYVRNFVDEKLHEFGRQGNVVMDGRDIGTTVFPDAQVKIFMTASEQVRAQRRYDELVAKGENPVMEDVVENLRQRDYIDSHRETSPLRQAADAYVLDNSDMTLSEEIAWVKGLLRGKYTIYD